MKITVIKDTWDDDYEGSLKTTVESEHGKESASFGSGEPEDFSLVRDLSDAYNIKNMLIIAYQAGKNGEKLEIEELEGEE